MVMRSRTVVGALLLALGTGCGTGERASTAEPSPSASSKAKAAVRPQSAVVRQALSIGTLRADPGSGCLWLEQPDGSVSAEVILGGEDYSVDFSTTPVSVLDGDQVVARVGSRVEVGGGFTKMDGVEGCPVYASVFFAYFEDRPVTGATASVSS